MYYALYRPLLDPTMLQNMTFVEYGLDITQQTNIHCGKKPSHQKLQPPWLPTNPPPPPVQLNKLVFYQFKPVCLSTVSYSSTAVWNCLYPALLNASLYLIQVSHSNSLFSLKSTCFEYVPILDPILPRSTHDCFSWIGTLNPVSF